MDRPIGSNESARTAREVVIVDATTGAPAGAGASAYQVQGAAASDAPAAGNPVLAGGVYTAAPAGVSADGDAVSWRMDNRGQGRVVLSIPDSVVNFYRPNNADGVASSSSNASIGVIGFGHAFNGNAWDRFRGDTNGLVVQPFALTGARWHYASPSGGLTDTSDIALSPAAGTGVRNYVTAIQYLNTSATPSELVIKDGSTVIWRGYAPANMNTPGTINFDVPLRGSPNAAISIAMLTSGSATRVSAQGFAG